MNILRPYIMLLLCAGWLHASAQSMEELFVAMPQHIVPYLTENQKKEMVECVHVGVSTSVQNQLHGTSTLDTLARDYCQLSLSSARRLQLVGLDCADGDSLVCIVDTYSSPKASSEISFWDTHWKKIDAPLMPEISLAELLHRPDTMSVSEMDSLALWFEPVLIELTYDPTEHILVASPSVPYVSVEEKDKLDAILCKRRLKWDGKCFVKSY